MSLVLRYAARSDRGLVRANNQDSVYAGPRLLAVADGMGGHAGGEVASKTAIAAIAPLDADQPGGDLLAQLSGAVYAGNEAIVSLVEAEPDLAGMGTTLTAVLFAGTRLGLAHVGDSRAYLMRDDELTQITHDDTFVQSLVDEGRLTEDEAANHPQRSLILRALNGDDIEPSLTVRETRAGDRYLLCSDGLSGVVSVETLSDALRIEDPQAGADRLIELALRSGGPDNITVIVADVVELDYGEDYPIVGGAVTGEEDDGQVPDTAAGRAAAVNPARATPRAVPSTAPVARRRRMPLMLAVIALVVVVVGALAGRAWLNSNFYVGEQDGAVAVLQGVPGSVLGYSLQEVTLQGCIRSGDSVDLAEPGSRGGDCDVMRVDDLQPAERGPVNGGLPGGNSDDARLQLERLSQDSLLPVCGTPAARSGTGTATSSVPTPNALPNSSGPTSSGPTSPTPESPLSATPTPTGTDLPAPDEKPGQTCRTGR